MTDYNWPSSVDPASVALTWMDNTSVFTSPLSGTTRTESRPGGRWQLTLGVQGLVSRSVQSNPLHLLEAFIFRLNGSTHRAVIPDFGYQRSGPGGGTPVVYGSGHTGLALASNGWPASTTVLYAGDRIGVSNQMIPITTDVTSDGSGIAEILLAHPIRTAPVHGSAIEIDAPTARYILAKKAGIATKPGKIKSLLLQFEEAIP